MPPANAWRGVIAKSLDRVLESEDALTVAVDVARLNAQNGLSSTGTSKYTMGNATSPNWPQGKQHRSIR
ncbi:MAG: hypothetical protein WA993_02115 [Candidatus Binatus sp.]|uniref:hypothetical protein n=1 Tax=Candidatus Binatus sp. TaxID=2811406 RepID=UPI003C8ED19A